MTIWQQNKINNAQPKSARLPVIGKKWSGQIVRSWPADKPPHTEVK